MPDLDAASVLRGWRRQAEWEASQPGPGRSSAYVRPLADAVMAAVELHKPIDRGRVMACCEGCEAVNGGFHEDCCHEWPCPTYEAILAALAGKAADDDRG